MWSLMDKVNILIARVSLKGTFICVCGFFIKWPLFLQSREMVTEGNSVMLLCGLMIRVLKIKRRYVYRDTYTGSSPFLYAVQYYYNAFNLSRFYGGTILQLEY